MIVPLDNGSSGCQVIDADSNLVAVESLRTMYQFFDAFFYLRIDESRGLSSPRFIVGLLLGFIMGSVHRAEMYGGNNPQRQQGDDECTTYLDTLLESSFLLFSH